MSATARSLAYPRTRGYRAQKVEQTGPKIVIMRDLSGVDVLALKSIEPVLVIQATTCANQAPCRDKLHRECFMTPWKGAGAVLEIRSWAKQGSKGCRRCGHSGGLSYEGGLPPAGLLLCEWRQTDLPTAILLVLKRRLAPGERAHHHQERAVLEFWSWRKADREARGKSGRCGGRSSRFQLFL